jgi:nucleotide-binding universal stress UspA family protein
MFERILVPLDGSARAERAIPVAARMARSSSATVILLQVVESSLEFGPYLTQPSSTFVHAVERRENDARAYLQRVAQGDDLKGLNVQLEVLEGAVDLKLHEVVERYTVDLIIMCSHNYSIFKRWMLGSVTDKIARRVHVPMLVLHERGETALVPPLFDTTPLRALVPLDGSAWSEAALLPTIQLLMELAPTTPKELHLLRIVDLPATAGIGKSAAHLSAGVVASVEKVALNYVEALAHELQQQIAPTADFTITSSVVTDNDVASAIVRIGEEERDGQRLYNLIAMATHGFGGVRHWVMGSVTEHVLHTTTLPLFILYPLPAKKNQEKPTTQETAGSTGTEKDEQPILWAN